MAEDDWGQVHLRDLAVRLAGDGIPSRDDRGEPIRDDTFYLVFNARDQGIEATLPARPGERWETVLDTASDDAFPDEGPVYSAGEDVPMAARSVVVLRLADAP